MRLRRPIAFILSAAVAASALTGCDSFSGHAAAAANSAQVQQLIEFIADLGLERDLRQALQKGGDLRQALLTLLGLESAVNFNVDDLAGARPGQHAVQVWEVTAQSAEDAAALAASQIRAVLEQLKSNGVTAGRIGMVEVNGKYYVVVDVEVTEENTFEPIRPASSDDDDDNEDTPPVSAKGVKTEDGEIFDVSELRGEITALKVLNIINEGLSGEEKYDRNDIVELDLSGYTGLTSISSHAFVECDSLEEINLSDCTNLERIGVGAFRECKNLTSINLSDCTSLQSINASAFTSSGLTSINLSDCTKLKSIGISAFKGCNSLTSIDLSNTQVDTINDTTFYNCSGLKTVKLPASLTTIGGWAFEGCSSLTSITLPASLTTISSWAFQNCSSLENIYFYGTVVPTIGTDAFKGVISDNDPSDKLTIHYPSSWDNDELERLKTELRTGGLTLDGRVKFEKDSSLDTLTSFLGL